MYSFCLSNVAVNPASQSWPIDNRDRDAKCGNMCACLACFGSCGMSRSSVCVAVIVALLGNITLMPLGIGMMFVIGMFVCTRFVLPVSSYLPLRKVPVAPVSATSGLLFVLLFVVVAVL